MKFMLMLFADEKVGAAMPKAEMAKAMEQMYAYQQTLEKAGAFVSTAALGNTWDARTITNMTASSRSMMVPMPRRASSSVAIS